MAINKLEKIPPYRPPGYGVVRIPPESEETKRVRKTGLEIDLIKGQTEAIKKGEMNKPVVTDSSFYLKKLNII